MSTVRAMTEADAPAWDAFVDAHPEGTFFHRAAWAEVFRRGFRHAPHFMLAEQDGVIAGVLPLAQVRTRLFGHTLMSAPFCVYGGPLAADPASYATLVTAAEALQSKLGAPVLEMRLRDPAVWPGESAWPSRSDLYVTFRKPIVANDDENMKAIPRKQRAMVRKGIDAGLTAEVSTDTDLLHGIYAESVRNLGTPVFSRRYFHLLAELFPGRMDVLTVRDGATPIASVLNFYDRGEVLPYYGGGTAAARGRYGNDFMYWAVMRHAAARGCRLFDFGRSKVGTGAFSFKKNWGFNPAPLHHRFHLAAGHSIPDHNPLNPKYRLMIAAWKRLPLTVANAVGPFVVRGVG